MEASLVIELVFQALWMALFLSGPILLGLLIVGLIISILQAATQLNETTVAFVPKIIVLAVVILMAGPSLLGLFSDYVREIILRIPTLMQ
ncbi:MAG: flagellar biosynthetic protein FliQ [Burkholderiaceae bacterium]|nr:flagellar type III secretion system protein FliQ [Betaproteobacteria bacterium]NBT84451.1 flagellar type III secretion system protein FliQ [Betaproteobacteria bacterium]